SDGGSATTHDVRDWTGALRERRGDGDAGVGRPGRRGAVLLARGDLVGGSPPLATAGGGNGRPIARSAGEAVETRRRPAVAAATTRDRRRRPRQKQPAPGGPHRRRRPDRTHAFG